MAMHRLPAGTEAPRWRLLVAVWVASMVLAAILAFGLNWLTGLHIAQVTTPILWLAIQWAAWLHLKDRPPRARPALEGEPEPDESPTLRLEAVEENSPPARLGPGDHRIGRDLDRPAGRHQLKENPEMPTVSHPPEGKPSPRPRPPADRNPAQAVLPADRFAPFTLERIEEAAIQLQITRWNFQRIRPIHPNEARTQWNALNRYLAEQVRREAHAALLTHQQDLSEARITAEFWDNAMLKMVGWFNPPDEDAASESICLDAIERAYRFAADSPCTCDDSVASEDDQFDACQRCQVLGRVRDVEVER